MHAELRRGGGDLLRHAFDTGPVLRALDALGIGATEPLALRVDPLDADGGAASVAREVLGLHPDLILVAAARLQVDRLPRKRIEFGIVVLEAERPRAATPHTIAVGVMRLHLIPGDGLSVLDLVETAIDDKFLLGARRRQQQPAEGER